MSLAPTEIWLLYQKELRSSLRERTIVVNSVLVPILLYPFMLWVMLTGLTFVMGVSSGLDSRIALLDLPVAHGALRDALAADDSVALAQAPGSAREAQEGVRRGELDAAVEFLPADPAGADFAGNFRARISYDRSQERSNRARQRALEAIEDYRTEWLDREAERLGVTVEEIEQFRLHSENVATTEEMGASLLGGLVPLFLVVMVAVGCFIPAVDSTAGERERNTWETTMTLSVSRKSMIVAKYLCVATFGMIAGSLNVIAVTVSLGPIMAPVVDGGAGSTSYSIPLSAIPVMILGAGLLSLFFAAAMMILASFARTFKDGQAMVTPVYWLALVPLVLGNSSDQQLTPQIAAIPVANVAMMIRDAIVGSFQPLLILETLAVGLVMVTACLWVAGRVLEFEDLVMGSYSGSFWTFAKERLAGGSGRST